MKDLIGRSRNQRPFKEVRKGISKNVGKEGLIVDDGDAGSNTSVAIYDQLGKHYLSYPITQEAKFGPS